jgi:hypothetical protein
MSDSSQSSQSRLDVALVNPKNVLKKQQLVQDLLVHLRAKITEYPSTHNLKGCSEFVLYVCKVVENVVVKKQKIDKKQLVLDVFKILFNLQPPEILALDASIEFLHSNGLISKIKVVKKLKVWFQKKLNYLC